MSFSEFTEKDYQWIRSDYELLRASAEKRCASEKELAVVEKAFEFANNAHRNVRRRSGEPYMLHPIAVARIVVDNIGLGYKSIAAALLHDVVEDTDYTVEDLRAEFGDKIASLVDGLTKIKNVLDTEQKTRGTDISQQSLQAENFKRILLTMN
ncbi:MAG: HD domain-containing protein, partial [Bacteroidales bacterium]|nr:HD domain-containing protein [Bacteroidales bacterium]